MKYPCTIAGTSEVVSVSSDDSPAESEQDPTELTRGNDLVEELCYTTNSDDTDNPCTSTKRTSSSYSPAAKRQQRQRKREQDKLAALKYRNRKKQEVLALDEQQSNLEQENAELVKQVKSAEEEIVMLKSLLREVYAPCNHGNPTANTMPQSNSSSSTKTTNTVVTTASVQHSIHDQSIDRSQDTPSSTSGSCGSSSDMGANNTDNMFAVIWNEFFSL